MAGSMAWMLGSLGRFHGIDDALILASRLVRCGDLEGLMYVLSCPSVVLKFELPRILVE
jgi:hypothetical protein